VLARAVLESEGFLVETAGSSTEVLERLRARTPDLILMDVQLPGQDGLTLIRLLETPNRTLACGVWPLAGW
jgi:CheY-like chemotaxis protein